MNNTCVKHNFKSVHVSNLFWSREYNSAKEICKYPSFSKVGGNYPLDLKIIWSSVNELNLKSKTIKLELWVKIHRKEFVFLCYFIWTSWILVTCITLYAETLNMACIQLITEWLRLKLTGNSIFTSNFHLLFIPRSTRVVYRDPHVRHTFGFLIIIKVPLNQIFSNFHTVYHKIQVKFDYGVFHIYRSWVMALFLLENRDFLDFRMIFKVWLNQIFSNFNTML